MFIVTLPQFQVSLMNTPSTFSAEIDCRSS